MTITSVVFVDIHGIGVMLKKMEFPFNFSKKIDVGRKNMSVNEYNIENEIKEEGWTNSFYGYEYKTIVRAEKESGPILGIRIELHIHREKLDIIEKIVRLKYGTSSHTFLQYIIEALVNQIEADLRSPESIAQNFCKNLLQKWLNETSEEVKKMQEKKPSPNTVLINKAGRDPLGW
jgi:hypothetical protein